MAASTTPLARRRSAAPVSVALLVVGELRGFLPDGWRSLERHVVHVLRHEAVSVDTFICTDSTASLPDAVIRRLRVVSTVVGAASSERDRLAQCFRAALRFERQAAAQWSHVLRARSDQRWLADMPSLTQLEPDAISLRARMLVADGIDVTADHMSWYGCGLLAGTSRLEPTCAPSDALALQRPPCALADDQWAVVPRKWAGVYFLGEANSGANHDVSVRPLTSASTSSGTANATLLRFALSSEQLAVCGSCFEARGWPEGRLMQRLTSHGVSIAIAPFRFRVASRACGVRSGTSGAPVAGASACAYDEETALVPPILPTYDCGLSRWRWAMEKGAAAAALRSELEHWRGGDLKASHIDVAHMPGQATAAVRVCRPGFKLERHTGQHGDVCRARDGSGNFVCPRACAQANAPLHCRGETGGVTLTPCRNGGATAVARPRPPRESYRTMAELFEATGYVMLPSALSAGRVERMAAAVRDHLLEHADEHSRVLCPHGQPCGARAGGWYVAAFEQHEVLAPIFDDLVGLESLREALQMLLGPHRVLARNEVYVNRWGNWHKDRTYAALRLYEREARPSRDVLARVARAGFASGSFEAWHVAHAAANETQRIVTVTAYLQDHRTNQQALSVQPGTHREGPEGESPFLPEETTLHPALGDLLLFDSDLTHRAMRPEAVVQQELSPTTRLNRTAISLSFGTQAAPHATEAFERGFALRSALLGGVNRTLCRTARVGRYDDLPLEHPCAYAAAVADMLLRPLDTLRAARRRRPYAFPSHERLCVAVARQGASHRIGSVPGLQQGLLRTLGCSS